MAVFKINLQKRDNILFLNEKPFAVLQHTNGRQAEYKLSIEPIGNNAYAVYAEFGKIGTNLKRQKIGGFNNIKDARKLFEKKLGEKRAKGYEIISNKL